MKAKIGWIPIRYFKTEKSKVCEAPRHKGMNIEAYGAIAIYSNDYPDGLVQMVCKECWEHFDNDLGNPNWSLIENER